MKAIRTTGYFLDPGLQRALEESELGAFDMNGLLVNDEPFHLEAVNLALNHLGISLTETDWIERCVGRRLPETLPAILAERNGHTDCSVMSLVESYRTHFMELTSDRIKDAVRPGVLDIIYYLSGAGKKLALVTSATMDLVQTIAGNEGIDALKFFDYVVTGDQIPDGRGKPNPDCYLMAARRAGIDPSRCIGFEDAHSGVEALYNARMHSIAVPCQFTYGHDFSKADYVVQDLTRSTPVLGRKSQYKL